MKRDRAVASAIAIVWLLFTAAVYLDDVGRGFIKDDFRWVLDGTTAVQHPLRAFVGGWQGNFYRPVVAFSFGLDHALYGLWARGYGLTNLVLYVGCTVAVFAVLREYAFALVPAAAGAFAWAINPSGLDMAVLWISGRTSLLMTLFSCTAIVAVLRRQRALACMLFAAALFSKEDALAVPVLVLVLKWLDGRPRREWLLDVAGMTLVACVYLALRSTTQAIGVGHAPEFYRLTWGPSQILENGVQYIDRAATSTLVLVVLLGVFSRAVPPFRAVNRRHLLVAAAWFVLGLCITVRVPVRSSLYVVFASIASGIVFAAVVEAVRRVDGERRDRWLLAALSVVLVLIPAYDLRNDRWVEPARVSARTFRALQKMPALAGARTIVFHDEAVPFSNLDAALGGVEDEALLLYTGRAIGGRVVPPDAPADMPADISVRLEHGAVTVATAQQAR